MEIVIVKASDLYYIQDPDQDEEYNTITAICCGIVIHEDDMNISISGFYFPKDGTPRNVITIPKSVIYYMKRVNIPDKVREE